MTREEILAKWDSMTPRERDALVAEKVMEWKERVDFDYVDGLIARYVPGTMDVVNFQPSTDISAAWEVEAIFDQDSEICEEYAIQLHNVLGLWLHEPTTLNNVFQFAHATAEQRCKAALLAVMKGQTNDL
jgi:hypothetical protein